MVTWVIERFVFDEKDEEALISEVKAQGGKVIELNPMKMDTLDPPTSLLVGCFFKGEQEPIVFRGSLNVVKSWVSNQAWYPGVIYNRNNFKCSKYYAYWGKYLMNHDYEFFLAKELIRYIDSFVFRPNTKFFLRPDCGDKGFSGGVFDLYEAKDLLTPLEPDTMVVQSSVKTIRSEYRFVIEAIEDQVPRVVTHSLYKGDGSGISEDYLVESVQQVIQEVGWHPDPLYVLDVGIEEGSTMPQVIELNSFSCSNLYGCDLKAVVSAVNNLAESVYKSISTSDW